MNNKNIYLQVREIIEKRGGNSIDSAKDLTEYFANLLEAKEERVKEKEAKEHFRKVNSGMPAFPEANEATVGMSKRFYAVCQAMNLPKEFIRVKLEDEDMVQNQLGNFFKVDEDYVNLRETGRDPIIEQHRKTLYSIQTTYEYRLTRALYRIANEILKQEDEL